MVMDLQNWSVAWVPQSQRVLISERGRDLSKDKQLERDLGPESRWPTASPTLSLHCK